jgi:hypothetical protein
MKLMKSLFFSLLVVLSLTKVKAQQIEIGLLLGTSHYLGDLSDEKINFKNTYFAASLFGRYNFSNKVAVSGMASFGAVSGDDKQSSLESSKLRNLNFSSSIYEFSVRLEYNLLKNDLRNISNRPFIPYVFAGLGVFKFNPQTTYIDGAGVKITKELQPLATEGQGSTVYNEKKKYDLTEIIIPMGIGFRTRISDAFYLGIEAGVRFTTTNYLDDVGGNYADNTVVRANTGLVASQLADRRWEVRPTDGQGFYKENEKRSRRSLLENDAYFITGITFSYMIRSKGQACPTFN